MVRNHLDPPSKAGFGGFEQLMWPNRATPEWRRPTRGASTHGEAPAENGVVEWEDGGAYPRLGSSMGHGRLGIANVVVR